MADLDLTQLTDDTDPGTDALLYVVTDPSVTAADRSVSLGNALKSAGGRERLTANRTYYVRTDGSDSNNGLTDSAGGAFLTIQKAVTVCASYINLNGFDVTIQVRDGTYDCFVLNSSFDGDGTVSIVGNSSTPTDVILQTSVSIPSVEIAGGASLTVTDISANSGYTDYFFIVENAKLQFSNIVFDGANSINIKNGGYVKALGNYEIVAVGGPVQNHLFIETGGVYETADLAPTLNFSGTAGFIPFATVETGGVANLGLYFNGAVTGRLFVSQLGGLVTSTGTGWSGDDGFADNSFYNNTSNFSVTSSATLVPVTGLTANIGGGATVHFTAKLFTTSNVAGGIKVAVSGTGTVSSITYETLVHSGATIAAQGRGTALGTSTGVTAVTAAYVEITGSFVTSGSGGEYGVYFAQNVSNATASVVLANSVFRVDTI